MNVKGSVTIPDLKKIASFEDLKKLRISHVGWYFNIKFGLRLNDGQYVESGFYHDFRRILQRLYYDCDSILLGID